MDSNTGFRADLAFKVARARQTFWQRVFDFLRGI